MAGTPPPLSGSENRTFICTVVFMDLVDYSRRPVTEQAALKRRLNELVGQALAQVAEADRQALDTGDGAALCFFGDPEDALFAAAHLRDAIKADPGPGGAQLRIGINLGPARLVRDVNGNRNIIGDGINVAQRVMSFAAPNQILVTRSYYEIVSHISHEYSQLFQYAGLHRDKHIREHELYEAHGPSRGASEPEPGRASEPAPEPVPLEPEVLARVRSALTHHLGPVAKLIVQRAALQARGPRQLIATAAESLAGNARAAFLAALSDLVSAPPASPAPPAAPGPPEPPVSPDPSPGRPRAAGPVTPEVLGAAEAQLARYVGPIARVLVAQAAREASDTAGLAERLASHIHDPAARQAFVTAMDRAGAP
jgi:class 3 adenylate cyclase